MPRGPAVNLFASDPHYADVNEKKMQAGWLFGRTARHWLKTVDFDSADALIENALNFPRDSYFIEACLQLYSSQGETMADLRRDWPKRNDLSGPGSRWTGVFKASAYAIYLAPETLGRQHGR